MDGESVKIGYHYGFYAAIQFEYERAGAKLTFLQEHDLGKEPVRLDMLIIKHRKRDALRDPIGSFFRKFNVIEYKSPEDGLDINDFYKAQGYACFYKCLDPAARKAPVGDLTVTLFRHTYPRKMLADLRDAGLEVEEAYPGVYRVSGAVCVPAQVVVGSRLPEGEYGEFKVLARGARRADVAKFLEAAQGNPSGHVSAILRVSMAANRELYQTLMEEGPMKDVFESLFHDMITEYIAIGEKRGIAIGEERGEKRGEKRGEERGEKRAWRSIMERLVAGGMKPQELWDRLIAGGMAPQEATALTGLAK